MVIRYIGLTEYNDIKEPININLGGPFIYEMVKDEENFLPHIRVKEKSNDYIYDLYNSFEAINPRSQKTKEYKGASEVSAIVGQNSAGKTSTIKMISNVLRENADIRSGKFSYFMIQEDTNTRDIYFSSNIYSERNREYNELEKSLRENGFNGGINYLREKEALEKKLQVYFSGVFDKASPIATDDNLYDISTNTTLDEFVRNVTSKKQESSIEDFRYQEVFHRIELATKYPDMGDILLFEFPEKVILRFTNRDEIRTEIYNRKISEVKNADKSLTRNLDEFDKNMYQLIDDIYNKAENGKSSDRVLRKEELAAFLIDEYIYSCLNNTEFSYEEIVSRLRNALKKRNNKPVILSRCLKKLGLEQEIKITRQDKSEEKLSKDKLDKVQKEKRELLESEIQETLERLFQYKDQLENFSEGDVWQWEFFEGLRKELKYGETKLGYPSADDLDSIMNPYWDNEEPVDYYSVEEIKSELQKCVEAYEDFLCNYFVSKDDLDEETNDKDKELDEQEELFVEDIDLYENLDIKVSRIISVYEKFEELIKIRNVIPLEESSSVPLFKKNTLELAKSGEKFMELYDLFFHKANQKFPDGFEILQATVDQFDVCSGYSGYFDMLARLARISDEIQASAKNDIVIMLDEGELYLHPQAQKDFILRFLMSIQCFFHGKDVQIIVSTNSPFILSDVQNSNIMCLNSLDHNGLTVCERDELGKTFGTNITTLLIKEFFMHEGVVGSFARVKINGILKRMEKSDYKDDEKKDFKLINIIGDDLVRGKLLQMYDEKTSYSKKEFYKKRIELYQQKIHELESMMED